MNKDTFIGFLIILGLFVTGGFALYQYIHPEVQVVTVPTPIPTPAPAPVYNFNPVSYYPVRAPSVDLPYPQVPPVIVLSQKPPRVLVVNRVAPAPSQYFYY